MSDNLNENLETNSEEQSENIETSDNNQQVENSEIEPQKGSNEQSIPEEEKIVITKKELNDRAKAIREIAERRTRRELEGKYKDEATNAQIQASQQQQYTNQQPSPNHKWDKVLGWIPQDITQAQYSQLVENALMQLNNGEANQNIGQTPQKVQNQKSEAISSEALEQIEDCAVEIKNFQQIVETAPISVTMANSAACSPNGIKLLLELQQKNPSEVYKISKLSPQKQQFEVWNYLRQKVTKPVPKVNSQATPQPESLKGGGITTKSYDEMSYAEKKKAREREIWGN